MNQGGILSSLSRRKDAHIKIEHPFGLFPVWGYYEKSCYEYTYTVLFVDICLHLSWINMLSEGPLLGE